MLCSCSLLQYPRHCEVYPPVLNTGTLLALTLDNTDCKNTSLNSPVYFLGHHHLLPNYHYWCYLYLCCCSGHCLKVSLLAQAVTSGFYITYHQAVFISWQKRVFQTFGTISRQSSRGVYIRHYSGDLNSIPRGESLKQDTRYKIQEMQYNSKEPTRTRVGSLAILVERIAAVMIS